MSATHIILIALCVTAVSIALIGAWVFQNIFKSEAKQDTPAVYPAAPAASSEPPKTDGKAAKAADKAPEAAKPTKPAPDKPKFKHGSLIGDVLWIIVGLAFINWFWAHTFNQSWQMLWTHESFWATQVGIVVVAVGFKNAKNSIVKGLCFVILIMTVISAGTIVLPTFYKSETKTPVAKTIIKSETVQAGEWSREYSSAELKSVTAVADREWQVCLIIDQNTQEEKIQELKPLPLGQLIKPWNAKWMRFRSMTREMKVEFWVLDTL